MLDLPKLKVYANNKLNQLFTKRQNYKRDQIADDKLEVAKMKISLLDSVQNTVGKGENAGYQHFLLSVQCFLSPYSVS